MCDSKIWIQICQKEKKCHPHENTQQPKIDSQITRQQIPTRCFNLHCPHWDLHWLFDVALTTLGLATPLLPTVHYIESHNRATCTCTTVAWTCVAALTLIAIIWTSHQHLGIRIAVVLTCVVVWTCVTIISTLHRQISNSRCHCYLWSITLNPITAGFASPYVWLVLPPSLRYIALNPHAACTCITVAWIRVAAWTLNIIGWTQVAISSGVQFCVETLCCLDWHSHH